MNEELLRRKYGHLIPATGVGNRLSNQWLAYATGWVSLSPATGVGNRLSVEIKRLLSDWRRQQAK